MTATPLPSPLVPPDVDLRKYPKMPLAFRRLFGSDTWILGTPEERCASLALWCESWHQVPASSLPNDDRVLSALSQTGQRWKRLKVHAMRGWVLCSDGRFYHPVVAEYALESWETMKKLAANGMAGAEKRWGPAKKKDGPATAELWPGSSNEVKGSEVKGKEEDSPPFVLPGWVPKAAWSEFEAMRIRIKKPLTDRARNLVVNELSRISGPTGQDAEAILLKSARAGWADVYPLKREGGGGAGREASNAAIAERVGRRG